MFIPESMKNIKIKVIFVVIFLIYFFEELEHSKTHFVGIDTSIETQTRIYEQCPSCLVIVTFSFWFVWHFWFSQGVSYSIPHRQAGQCQSLVLIAGFDHCPEFQSLRNKNRCHQIPWFSLEIKNMEIFNLTKNKCCNGTLIINLIPRVLSFQKICLKCLHQIRTIVALATPLVEYQSFRCQSFFFGIRF